MRVGGVYLVIRKHLQRQLPGRHEERLWRNVLDNWGQVQGRVAQRSAAGHWRDLRPRQGYKKGSFDNNVLVKTLKEELNNHSIRQLKKTNKFQARAPSASKNDSIAKEYIIAARQKLSSVNHSFQSSKQHNLHDWSTKNTNRLQGNFVGPNLSQKVTYSEESLSSKTKQDPIESGNPKFKEYYRINRLNNKKVQMKGRNVKTIDPYWNGFLQKQALLTHRARKSKNRYVHSSFHLYRLGFRHQEEPEVQAKSERYPIVGFKKSQRPPSSGCSDLHTFFTDRRS